jgi:hypothetical protein
MIMAVKSITYTETPFTVKTAMIRAKVLRLTTQLMTHEKVIQMEGGQDALEKYGPVFDRD